MRVADLVCGRCSNNMERGVVLVVEYNEEARLVLVAQVPSLAAGWASFEKKKKKKKVASAYSRTSTSAKECCYEYAALSALMHVVPGHRELMYVRPGK